MADVLNTYVALTKSPWPTWLPGANTLVVFPVLLKPASTLGDSLGKQGLEMT